MKFDPNVIIRGRIGPEPLMNVDKPWTTGMLAVLGLDNMAGKGEHKQLTRQFRIGTQIIDAQERGVALEFPDDDFEIIEGVVREVCAKLGSGVLMYGRFCQAVQAMKGEGRADANGQHEPSMSAAATQ